MDTSKFSEQGKFDFEIDLFIDYLFNIEGFLQEEIQKHTKVVEHGRATTPDTQTEPSAEVQDRLFRLEVRVEFTNLLRKSVFVRHCSAITGQLALDGASR